MSRKEVTSKRSDIMSKKELQEIFEKVKQRDPEQTEFHQVNQF